jgi:hypothetical protein
MQNNGLEERGCEIAKSFVAAVMRVDKLRKRAHH